MRRHGSDWGWGQSSPTSSGGCPGTPLWCRWQMPLTSLSISFLWSLWWYPFIIPNSGICIFSLSFSLIHLATMFFHCVISFLTMDSLGVCCLIFKHFRFFLDIFWKSIMFLKICSVMSLCSENMLWMISTIYIYWDSFHA